MVGDSTQTISALNGALNLDNTSETQEHSAGCKRATDLRRKVRESWWSQVFAFEPILNLVNEIMDDPVIVGDQTQPIYAANQFYQPGKKRSWFNSSTGYGTLGYALPAGIGAKLANESRQVVVIIGDGGIQFTLPELASAMEADASVTVLVWNNQGYGEIKTFMENKNIPTIGVDLYTPDFVALAKGFGCAGRRARNLYELQQGLEDARHHRGCSLIELDQADFIPA